MSKQHQTNKEFVARSDTHDWGLLEAELDRLLDESQAFAEGVAYAGFDPAALKKVMLARASSVEVAHNLAKDIIEIITLFLIRGTNVDKLSNEATCALKDKEYHW